MPSLSPSFVPRPSPPNDPSAASAATLIPTFTAIFPNVEVAMLAAPAEATGAIAIPAIIYGTPLPKPSATAAAVAHPDDVEL